MPFWSNQNAKRRTEKPAFGLYPGTIGDGILFNVSGRLEHTPYTTHRIVCGEYRKSNSLLEPLVANKQVVDFILDNERRGEKRNSGQRLFERQYNYGIEFSSTSAQRKVILLARGVCVREPWLYSPGTVIAMCKFLRFQAEQMPHNQRDFLTNSTFHSSLFWHTALLSSYHSIAAPKER